MFRPSPLSRSPPSRLITSNLHPCDRGSDREVLEVNPEFSGFDLSALTSDWNKKEGFYAADSVSLAARGKWVRQWLRAREEKDIVVVSHAACLRYITEGYNSGRPWANTEVRVYTFAEEDDEDAKVVRVTEEG